MLYRQVEIYAPTRLPELNQTLFGVFRTDYPFWGVYDCFDCDNPSCGRKLHAILMDDALINIIDQMARQLYGLLDRSYKNELVLRKASNKEKDRARRMLTNIAFFTQSEPFINDIPPPDRLPDYWIAEIMCNAMAFLVVHEATHLGPQAAGLPSFEEHIPRARAAADKYKIELSDDKVVAWAKELGADIHAFMTMRNDRPQKPLPDAVQNGYHRSVAAGVALALKAWDLLIYERCYGNSDYHKMIVGGHPPARARIEYMLEYAATTEYPEIASDKRWANRIIDALDDLHM